jgi:YjbE family integral membrane protein
MLEILGAIGGIILVDLTLSGDNALVIGAAAAGLPAHQRRLAILLGGAGAIVLRILFAIVATLLLQLPLLQALGGLVLLFIAVRLLMGREVHAPEGTSAAASPSVPAAENKSFVSALTTIVIADVTMSLDNVLAIGALAAGQLTLLVVGLLLSIAIVLAGSALVAALIRRLPWLLDLAALVLGWTAAGMVLHDIRLGPILEQIPGAQIIAYALGLGIVLAADIYLRWRARRTQRRQPPPPSTAPLHERASPLA